MKKTEKLGLNLLETSDLLSVKPLNENAQKLEQAVAANTAAISGRVKMASGSYVGNGASSVQIMTPGFKPQVVLMRQKRELGVSAEGVVYTDQFSVDGGWARWAGEGFLWTNIYAPDVATSSGTGLIEVAKINFTAAVGSLTWTTHYGSINDVNKNINNETGVTYEWIAFGIQEESQDGIQ